MKRLITVAALAVALVALGGASQAEATDHAKRYYLSLGDSLADSAQPNGDLAHGYAEQLHAALAATDPGETGQVRLRRRVDESFRFGSQDPPRC